MLVVASVEAESRLTIVLISDVASAVETKVEPSSVVRRMSSMAVAAAAVAALEIGCPWTILPWVSR